MFCFEFEGKRPTAARPTEPVEGTSSELWVEGSPPYYQELAQRHRVGAVQVGDRP